MKNKNRNKEARPKHQKQVHEKKRQNILWKQRNIGNKYELRKKIAFKYHATRGISSYNSEIDKKVSSGLLDVEKAIKMKEEFLRQIDILIQMWSEDEDKKLKERLAELLSTKEVTEELIIEFHKKGYSISKIAESVDVPIARVMDVLSRIGEESDVDKTLDEIEMSH